SQLFVVIALAIHIYKSQLFVVIALAIHIYKSQLFVVIALAIHIYKSLKRLLQARFNVSITLFGFA
ncbi:MAG: hypothetical protein SXA11_25270, partial [Cyanobacteriota bacterium]|nr:hypothetical protein [Cyanobacteriota bacterium]